MVKFAKGEQKPFNPIEKNTINSLAAPPPPLAPPALAEAGPLPELAPEAEKEAPKPPVKRAGKRSPLEKITKQPERGERLTRVVKCLFTPSEEMELRKLVARLADEANTSLSLSHLIRPYFDLLLHCEAQLTQELGRAELTRPLNDKTALAFFERRLAQVIHAAFRKAPPLRTDHQDSEA
ncbi:MAG TPA: hypothetical protein VKP69_13660 [Isosphaeraceae bacterium]|nr:hypothetical protein [Isosphaeraceae bacterium]